MGKFVALEIGSKISKIVYGQDKKDDIKIIDYRLIENTEKIFGPDGDLNINEIQPLLKGVLKDMRVRRAECYLTVCGQSGIVRLREMPMVKLKEMKEIVRFEAEQFLPYNIEAFYLDFRVNQIREAVSEEFSTEEGSDQLAEIMIVAAPKDTVDDQVNLVDKLRLNIKRVDYYTDAVYCYFKKYILKEDKNTLVVDLGAKGMHLTMFNGNRYFANIQSELGIEDLIERYSENNNASINDARQALLNVEIEKPEAQVLYSAESKLEKLRDRLQLAKLKNQHVNSIEYEIEPALERLYEPIGYEVTKMMEFFKTRQFGMSVDEIYLIGGGANLKQFKAFLKYYHNLPVEIVQNTEENSKVSEMDYRLLIPVLGGLLKGGQ